MRRERNANERHCTLAVGARDSARLPLRARGQSRADRRRFSFKTEWKHCSGIDLFLLFPPSLLLQRQNKPLAVAGSHRRRGERAPLLAACAARGGRAGRDAALAVRRALAAAAVRQHGRPTLAARSSSLETASRFSSKNVGAELEKYTSLARA